MTTNQPTSGSSFYLFLLVLALSGLIYFLIWSFTNRSLQGGLLAATFAVMLLSSVAIIAYLYATGEGKIKFLSAGTFSGQSLWFVIGFLASALIAYISPSATQSVVSLPETAVFSTLSGELPEIVDWVMNRVVIPIAEESFWMIALPAVLILFLKNLSNKYSFFSNVGLQVFIIWFVTAVTFAVFHVAQVALVSFVVAALLFRAILVVTVIGDHKIGWAQNTEILLGFAFGYHIGNNMVRYGISDSISLLMNNPMIGLVVGFAFVVIILAALDKIGSLLDGRGVISRA